MCNDVENVYVSIKCDNTETHVCYCAYCVKCCIINGTCVCTRICMCVHAYMCVCARVYTCVCTHMSHVCACSNAIKVIKYDIITSH